MRAFIEDFGPLLWPISSAILVLLLRAHTPEEWVALGERSPRAQGAIRLLRALGVDPVKALAAIRQIVSGRAPAVATRVADAISSVQASPVPTAPQPVEEDRDVPPAPPREEKP